MASALFGYSQSLTLQQEKADDLILKWVLTLRVAYLPFVKDWHQHLRSLPDIVREMESAISEEFDMLLKSDAKAHEYCGFQSRELQKLALHKRLLSMIREVESQDHKGPRSYDEYQQMLLDIDKYTLALAELEKYVGSHFCNSTGNLLTDSASTSDIVQQLDKDIRKIKITWDRFSAPCCFKNILITKLKMTPNDVYYESLRLGENQGRGMRKRIIWIQTIVLAKLKAEEQARRELSLDTCNLGPWLYGMDRFHHG